MERLDIEKAGFFIASVYFFPSGRHFIFSMQCMKSVNENFEQKLAKLREEL